MTKAETRRIEMKGNPTTGDFFHEMEQLPAELQEILGEAMPGTIGLPSECSDSVDFYRIIDGVGYYSHSEGRVKPYEDNATIADRELEESLEQVRADSRLLNEARARRLRGESK